MAENPVSIQNEAKLWKHEPGQVISFSVHVTKGRGNENPYLAEIFI